VIRDEHLQPLLDQRQEVDIQQVRALVAGDSGTGWEGSDVKRRCWEVPSWLEIAPQFEAGRVAALYLATR
jgi:hypothetical protein